MGVISPRYGTSRAWLTPLKSTQNCIKTAFGPKIFLACGALKGLRLRASPESATLAVTIIPVTKKGSLQPRVDHPWLTGGGGNRPGTEVTFRTPSAPSAGATHS